jgi:hypothetical protein
MTPPISDKLQNLSAVAAKLNAETDSLNEVIEQLEDDLGKAGLGLTYWLENTLTEILACGPKRKIDERDLDADKYPGAHSVASACVLGYIKIADRWRLAVKSAELVFSASRAGFADDDWEVRDVGQEPIALAHAPRNIRMQAPAQFEALVDGLTSLAESMLEGIELAKKTAKS